MLLEVGLLGLQSSDVGLHLGVLALLVDERAFQLSVGTIKNNV